MSITYDEWAKSATRDLNPLEIERSVLGVKETILYDRFVRAFILVNARKVIPVETLLANP